MNKTSLPSISLLNVNRLAPGFLHSDSISAFLLFQGTKLLPMVTKPAIFQIHCLLAVFFKAFKEYHPVSPMLNAVSNMNRRNTTMWFISTVMPTIKSLL